MNIIRYGYRWTWLGWGRWEVAWPSPTWHERRIYQTPPPWVQVEFDKWSARTADAIEAINKGD